MDTRCTKKQQGRKEELTVCVCVCVEKKPNPEFFWPGHVDSSKVQGSGQMRPGIKKRSYISTAKDWYPLPKDGTKNKKPFNSHLTAGPGHHFGLGGVVIDRYYYEEFFRYVGCASCFLKKQTKESLFVLFCVRRRYDTHKIHYIPK